MKGPRITMTPVEIPPWPRANALLFKPATHVRPGLTFRRQPMPSVAGLIGDLMAILPPGKNCIIVDMDGYVDKRSDDPMVDVRVVSVIEDFNIPPHSFEGHAHLKPYVTAFVTTNYQETNHLLRRLRLHCHLDGLFWEDIPSGIPFDEPTNGSVH